MGRQKGNQGHHRGPTYRAEGAGQPSAARPDTTPEKEPDMHSKTVVHTQLKNSLHSSFGTFSQCTPIAQVHIETNNITSIEEVCRMARGCRPPLHSSKIDHPRPCVHKSVAWSFPKALSVTFSASGSDNSSARALHGAWIVEVQKPPFEIQHVFGHTGVPG